VFSGSEDLDDIKKSYLLGASGYLVKPQQFETLCQIIKTLYDLWLYCEPPAVDQDGKLLQTSSQGKLGERIKQA
jgi:DNA-binding NarL/FixJ family response regulator